MSEPEIARNRPDFRSSESPSHPLGRAWDKPGTIRGTAAVSTKRDDAHGTIKSEEPVDTRVILHFATELSALVQAGAFEGARSVHAIIGRLLAGESPSNRIKSSPRVDIVERKLNSLVLVVGPSRRCVCPNDGLSFRTRRRCRLCARDIGERRDATCWASLIVATSACSRRDMQRA